MRPAGSSDAAGYGVVIGLLIGSVAVSVVAPQANWTRALVIALEGTAVLVAVSRSTARQTMWLLLAVAPAVAIALAFVPDRSVALIASALNAVVLLSLPVAVVVRFRSDVYVTMESVFGAISIYLVIGMLFATFDSALSSMTGRPFFAQAENATTSQYTYFSFITLCTVGYGDLTPSSALARGLAVSEALIGQLYLVTVIALVISNVGRQRRVRDRQQ